MLRADLDISTPYVAPRSDTERLLCELMARALDIEMVGIDDDFFRLGGDSLGAESLFLTIEEATGRRLPLATLYERPTARFLAECVTASPNDRAYAPIVKIRQQGTQPPLFIVPGIGGEVINMEPLARYLGDDQPIYCCQFVGLDAAVSPMASIDEMASAFLAEIRRIQPVGPYHLLGSCFGGLVAFELAHRLDALNEDVGLLCLVDTPFPDPNRARRQRRRVIAMLTGVRFVVDRTSLFARELAARPRGERIPYLRTKMLRIGAILRARSLPHDVELEIAKRRVIDFNRAASRAYVPRPYDGTAIYLRSDRRVRGPSQERRRLWPQYFQAGFEEHRIACRDTGEMLGAGHAGDVAVIVSTAMRVAQSGERRVARSR